MIGLVLGGALAGLISQRLGQKICILGGHGKMPLTRLCLLARFCHYLLTVSSYHYRRSLPPVVLHREHGHVLRG
jgi:hypothetical protein